MKPNESRIAEGVPVFIDETGNIYNEWHTLEGDKINGYAFTFEQLAERDKAIARAAFIRGRCRSGHQSQMDWDYPTADDYLQSEEFKKLVGEK